ncbi:MAG: hypothetical protein ACK4OE_17550 [Acidovorax sp.]|uniref:hypothetical protein n=1 Tax=Acidovorax sp. TaxID=1872122 RepID=UPI003919CAE1
MKKLVKVFVLISSATLAVFGWMAWGFVHDVTSQHFGAFGVQRLALAITCVGIGLLLICLIFGFPYSRLVLGACALLSFIISIDSIFNYPAEYDSPAYSMMFSPEVTELYFSMACGIGLFLIALIFPKIKRR